ncbi:MAG: hypothetical protein CMM10_15000 [Rhodospirillaceae bacterium]|nr:hypothetical protein [Rhodospirillaceae bacterium]
MSDAYQSWEFFKELNPQFLNYICLLGGHRPPSIAGKFSYCEIGCRGGVTLNGLAQIYPDADFTGIDAEAGLIENAGALASAAGLENTRFLELNVAEIGNAKLPEFDYIVIGDIYSSLDPEARNRLREFIGAKLKSGGVLFVGYHTLPGWSAIQPLRDLMLQHTAPMTSDAAAKAKSGLDYLAHLRDKKAGFFADNPPLSTFLDGLMERDIKEVAHELFSAPVKPYYFHQVTAEMRSAGMTYSGSALLNLNFVDIAVPAEFHDLLRNSATRIEFETHGDYIRNQRFRKDVFIKDDPTLEEQERDAMLAEMPFGTNCDADSFNREVRFGEVHLKYIADIFELLIEHLSAGARTVGQLKELDAFAGYGPELITDGIRFLSASEQLLPFRGGTEAPDAAALAADRFTLPVPFNLAILKARLLQQSALGFVSTGAGVGFEISMSDALFALCSAEAPRDQLADWVSQRLVEAKKQMNFEEGSEIEAIEIALKNFHAQRLPKFLELGFLAPAAG